MPPPPKTLRVLDQKNMCCMPLKPCNNCFRSMLPNVCRSGKNINNVHNLQFGIELNDLTTCGPIFH